MFEANISGLQIVNDLYMQEFARLNQAILENNKSVISEYTKRVKTGGASQLA